MKIVEGRVKAQHPVPQSHIVVSCVIRVDMAYIVEGWLMGGWEGGLSFPVRHSNYLRATYF